MEIELRYSLQIGRDADCKQVCLRKMRLPSDYVVNSRR